MIQRTRTINPSSIQIGNFTYKRESSISLSFLLTPALLKSKLYLHTTARAEADFFLHVHSISDIPHSTFHIHSFLRSVLASLDHSLFLYFSYTTPYTPRMPIASTLMRSVDPITTIGTLFALLSSLIFYKTYLLPNFLSPLRHIPGPPNKSKYNKYNLPFLGNFPDILNEEAGIPHRQWIEQYGGIVCYRGLFNSQRILVADPKAIQHVFNTNSYKYPKPSNLVRLLGKVIGHGVLLAEGDVHRKQRKMLNPAFSHKHIKDMVHIMAGPAETLGRQWEEQVNRSGEKPFELDITVDLGSCTLDIIGLSGFGYDFQALTNPDNEMSMAYRELFYKETTSAQFLRVFIPYYSDLPTKGNLDRNRAIKTIDRVAMQIINEKRALANAQNPDEDDSKDLMSILIRGNEQVGSLEDGKLTDTELKDQV